MKPVLILTYFYPPCNLTAAQRVASWYRYLPQFGLYPIVVTRRWDFDVKSEIDLSRSTNSELQIERSEQGEIHYVPFRGNIRDRWHSRFGDKLRIVRKVMTAMEKNFRLRYPSILGYYNLMNYCAKLIEKRGLEDLVISGHPFELFGFGYELKRRYPQINWIADYRDDWSTSEIDNIDGKIPDFILRREAKYEKLWLSNSKCFSSVSPHYVKKISDLVKRPGFVLYNGFEPRQRNLSTGVADNNLSITYNGTLYPSQNIEVFLEGVLNYAKQMNGSRKLSLKFPGLAFMADQAERVASMMSSSPENVELLITERIPKAEVLEIQEQSDVLLMSAHGNLKGIPSSKIYEYLSFEKPVLLCPDDGDIIREILDDVQLGFFANSPEEVGQHLDRWFTEKEKHGALSSSVNQTAIEKYTRSHQVSVLAEQIKSQEINER